MDFTHIHTVHVGLPLSFVRVAKDGVSGKGLDLVRWVGGYVGA